MSKRSKRLSKAERDALNALCGLSKSHRGAACSLLPTDRDSNYWAAACRIGIGWTRDEWDDYLEHHPKVRQGLERAYQVALDQITAEHLRSDRGKEAVARANNTALMTPQERLALHQCKLLEDPESSAGKLARHYSKLVSEVLRGAPPTDAPLYVTLKEAHPEACPKTTTELASLIDYWCRQADPAEVTALVEGWRKENPETEGSKALRDRASLNLRPSSGVDGSEEAGAG